MRFRLPFSFFNDVFGFLEDIKINSSEITNEKNVENIVAQELKSVYEKVHQQFNVGGYLGLKIDIDINEEIGIEIKLAKDLDVADKIHRLFGQAIYYDRRKYTGDIIVLIVGSKKERDSPMLAEMMDLLEELELNPLFLVTRKQK